jgi:hypothetical protein
MHVVDVEEWGRVTFVYEFASGTKLILYFGSCTALGTTTFMEGGRWLYNSHIGTEAYGRLDKPCDKLARVICPRPCRRAATAPRFVHVLCADRSMLDLMATCPQPRYRTTLPPRGQGHRSRKWSCAASDFPRGQEPRGVIKGCPDNVNTHNVLGSVYPESVRSSFQTSTEY